MGWRRSTRAKLKLTSVGAGRLGLAACLALFLALHERYEEGAVRTAGGLWCCMDLAGAAERGEGWNGRKAPCRTK